jgi:hypothetical protein
MMIDILNKIFLFLLILSILNVIRNSFFLVRSFKDGDRFKLNKPSLLILGMSISYIILTLIEGIKI